MSRAGGRASDRGSNRRDQPGGGWGEAVLMWTCIAIAVTAIGGVYAAAHLGHSLAGLQAPPKDPFETFFGVLDGSVAWPAASTAVAVAAVAVVALAAVVAVRVVSCRRRARSRVDWTASVLGRGREIEGISEKASRDKARGWGIGEDAVAGVAVGRSLADGRTLYGSYEDVMLLVAGPRAGKTLCYAIPALLDAPGAVLVTSNKRDIVDATRDVRAGRGEVWVFDPQAIVDESPEDWWWNPLSYVVDDVTAAKMADHFAIGARPANATPDSYFEPEGRDLLSGLLLAAALDGRPITEVYRWLTRPEEKDPVKILQAGGYELLADSVASVQFLHPKQRDGVYGTGKQMAACLRSRAVERWVTDHDNSDNNDKAARGQFRASKRREFNPREFVRSTGALYSLSKEGQGTAGPLVTALTVAVVEAAEELAKTQARGRLATPLVVVLDEAANVCKWRDLPDLYSHYGSRGIVIMTILQNWSQGVVVWGRDQMLKLFSAANIKIYAGGVSEVGFLDDLTKLIGTYDKVTRSRSTRPGSGGTSLLGLGLGEGAQVSEQVTRELIFEVADLASLPRARAVLLSSGNRPTLASTLPWTEGPHSAAVRASIEAHDPEAGRTLRELEDGAHEVHAELASADRRWETSR